MSEGPQDAKAAAPQARTATGHAETAGEHVDERQLGPQEEYGTQGAPFERRSPFYLGFFGALGALLAYFLWSAIMGIGSTLILIVVSLFLAAGLNPSVEALERRGLRRSWAVTAVITAFLAAVALFVVAIVPVITDQVTAITKSAPEWLEQLQKNRQIQKLDDEYDIISKIQDYVANGDFVSGIFGGVLGVGLKILGALFNAFIILVLTLYFLSSLEKTKQAFYRLAPASRRSRVALLGDQIIRNVGGYVSGAFIVALCAGISTLVFLFIVGLGQYAVALAFVVALLDVIPMIGATLGAVVVTAIATATDIKTGIFCAIFFLIYQQVENYLIYPRVMSKSVDLPGAVIVIAALIGAGLLGVVGALLAIPTAAAIMLILREVVVRRQDAR
ncbi:AI-2E family transporter [Nocardioides sp. cx-173]|uniref:AI-2E family transporter n=1 Tax=Nocardioides sp. cx-173 TaxID=2898796 RepID=UPI001E50D504|nr:AI-2E family transporter [Nocardioides sp. cx-173]MCD4526226.1 AI-2E family transporter [Nocardioides sp. cx-173]UGB40564.1 AI-2E family transporter [Nocardioides sp. cx-173]